MISALKQWIEHQQAAFASLEGLEVITSGSAEALDPPFIGITTPAVDTYEQDGVTLYGVNTYQINVELHTLPLDLEDGGTPTASEYTMQQDLFDILGDRDGIAWMNGHGWTVFDIRAALATTEAQDGRRVSRWNLTAVAAPL